MCHAVDEMRGFVPPFCTGPPFICNAFQSRPKSRPPLLADTCSRRIQQRQESVSFNVFARNDTYCQRSHHIVRSASIDDHCDEISGVPSPGASQERRIGATVTRESPKGNDYPSCCRADVLGRDVRFRNYSTGSFKQNNSFVGLPSMLSSPDQSASGVSDVLCFDNTKTMV
jgi:hypothetical protein